MKIFLPILLIATGVAALSSERCWELSGGALYWKPCGQPFEYGADIRDAGNVRSLTLKPDYDWGFRLAASTYTHDCCHCWWIDWAYLRTTDSTRRTGVNIVSFPAQAGLNDRPTARASLDFRYNRVNVRAGRYLSCHCQSRLYGFGGLRYVDIQRTQQLEVRDFSGGFNRSWEKSEFQGAAFEVGGGVEVEEPYNLYAVGHIAGLMCIGERRYQQKLITTGVNNFRYPSQTTCVAGMQALIGVEWRYEGRCFWLTVQVSYELDHYFDALRMRSGTNAVATTPLLPTTTVQGVGFSGPGLHLIGRF